MGGAWPPGEQLRCDDGGGIDPTLGRRLAGLFGRNFSPRMFSPAQRGVAHWVVYRGQSALLLWNLVELDGRVAGAFVMLQPCPRDPANAALRLSINHWADSAILPGLVRLAGPRVGRSARLWLHANLRRPTIRRELTGLVDPIRLGRPPAGGPLPVIRVPLAHLRQWRELGDWWTLLCPLDPLCGRAGVLITPRPRLPGSWLDALAWVATALVVGFWLWHTRATMTGSLPVPGFHLSTLLWLSILLATPLALALGTGVRQHIDLASNLNRAIEGRLRATVAAVDARVLAPLARQVRNLQAYARTRSVGSCLHRLAAGSLTEEAAARELRLAGVWGRLPPDAVLVLSDRSELLLATFSNAIPLDDHEMMASLMFEQGRAIVAQAQSAAVSSVPDDVAAGVGDDSAVSTQPEVGRSPASAPRGRRSILASVAGLFDVASTRAPRADGLRPFGIGSRRFFLSHRLVPRPAGRSFLLMAVWEGGQLGRRQANRALGAVQLDHWRQDGETPDLVAFQIRSNRAEILGAAGRTHGLADFARAVWPRRAMQMQRGALLVAQPSRVLEATALVARLDLTPLRFRLFVEQLQLGVGLVLVLLLVYIAARLLSTSLVRPIGEMTVALRAVGGGDFRVRLAVDRLDELGETARQLEAMAASLEQRHELSRFVSPLTVSAVTGGTLSRGDGRRRSAVVLVSDVRDFTTLSETWPPPAIFSALNRHFAVMAPAIAEHGGIIDRFIGDAVVAVFFDAPDHPAAGGAGPGPSRPDPGRPSPPRGADDSARRALLAARRMIDGHRRLQLERTRDGEFTYRIGVGLAAGQVITGVLGDSAHRLDFCVLGEAIAVAAEVENRSKHGCATRVVCTDEIRARAGADLAFIPLPDGPGAWELADAPGAAAADVVAPRWPPVAAGALESANDSESGESAGPVGEAGRATLAGPAPSADLPGDGPRHGDTGGGREGPAAGGGLARASSTPPAAVTGARDGDGSVSHGAVASRSGWLPAGSGPAGLSVHPALMTDIGVSTVVRTLPWLLLWLLPFALVVGGVVGWQREAAERREREVFASLLTDLRFAERVDDPEMAASLLLHRLTDGILPAAAGQSDREIITAVGAAAQRWRRWFPGLGWSLAALPPVPASGIDDRPARMLASGGRSIGWTSAALTALATELEVDFTGRAAARELIATFSQVVLPRLTATGISQKLANLPATARTGLFPLPEFAVSPRSATDGAGSAGAPAMVQVPGLASPAGEASRWLFWVPLFPSGWRPSGVIEPGSPDQRAAAWTANRQHLLGVLTLFFSAADLAPLRTAWLVADWLRCRGYRVGLAFPGDDWRRLRARNHVIDRQLGGDRRPWRISGFRGRIGDHAVVSGDLVLDRRVRLVLARRIPHDDAGRISPVAVVVLVVVWTVLGAWLSTVGGRRQATALLGLRWQLVMLFLVAMVPPILVGGALLERWRGERESRDGFELHQRLERSVAAIEDGHVLLEGRVLTSVRRHLVRPGWRRMVARLPDDAALPDAGAGVDPLAWFARTLRRRGIPIEAQVVGHAGGLRAGTRYPGSVARAGQAPPFARIGRMLAWLLGQTVGSLGEGGSRRAIQTPGHRESGDAAVGIQADLMVQLLRLVAPIEDTARLLVAPADGSFLDVGRARFFSYRAFVRTGRDAPLTSAVFWWDWKVLMWHLLHSAVAAQVEGFGRLSMTMRGIPGVRLIPPFWEFAPLPDSAALDYVHVRQWEWPGIIELVTAATTLEQSIAVEIASAPGSPVCLAAVPPSLPALAFVVALPAEPGRQAVASQMGQMRAALLLLLLLTPLLAWQVANHCLQPVIALAAAAVRVGRGDFSPRLPEDRADEFGALAAAFNGMAIGMAEGRLLQIFVSDSVRRVTTDRDLARTARAGASEPVVVLFAGLVGFKEVLHAVAPEQMVGDLDRHLATAGEIVRRYGGEIDKFIGDKVLAVFRDQNETQNDQSDRNAMTGQPAPGSAADRALAAAVALQQATAARQGVLPRQAAIGLVAGPVLSGILGAATARLEHTVIGDTVNLASRLCDLAARQSGGAVLADQRFAGLLSPTKALVPMGGTRVKGKSREIEVFAWLNRAIPPAGGG